MHFHYSSRIYGDLAALRVCPHKSVRTQQHAAEIPRHHNAHIGQTGFLKHIEHRHSASALRLAVVGVASCVLVTQDISIDIVPCLAVLRAYALDERNSFVSSLYRRNVPDKFAFLFNKAVLRFLINGLVAHSRPFKIRI